jgi:hypothetical protein
LNADDIAAQGVELVWYGDDAQERRLGSSADVFVGVSHGGFMTEYFLLRAPRADRAPRQHFQQ